MILLLGLSVIPTPLAARGSGGAGGGPIVSHRMTASHTVRSRHEFGRQRIAHHPASRHFAGQQTILPIWPDGWGPDESYVYQPVQQTEAPPPEPQVIVMRIDGGGHTETAAATPDLSYAQGCHAIPNGYHCDVEAEGR